MCVESESFHLLSPESISHIGHSSHGGLVHPERKDQKAPISDPSLSSGVNQASKGPRDLSSVLQLSGKLSSKPALPLLRCTHCWDRWFQPL